MVLIIGIAASRGAPKEDPNDHLHGSDELSLQRRRRRHNEKQAHHKQGPMNPIPKISFRVVAPPNDTAKLRGVSSRLKTTQRRRNEKRPTKQRRHPEASPSQGGLTTVVRFSEFSLSAFHSDASRRPTKLKSANEDEEGLPSCLSSGRPL